MVLDHSRYRKLIQGEYVYHGREGTQSRRKPGSSRAHVTKTAVRINKIEYYTPLHTVSGMEAFRISNYYLIF